MIVTAPETVSDHLAVREKCVFSDSFTECESVSNC